MSDLNLEDQIFRLRELVKQQELPPDAIILRWTVAQTNYVTVAAYKLLMQVKDGGARFDPHFVLYGEADLLYFIGQVIDNTPKPTIRLLIEDLEAMVDIYDL